ncbi:hypothetical protein D3C78_872820 [compost metagenome]
MPGQQCIAVIPKIQGITLPGQHLSPYIEVIALNVAKATAEPDEVQRLGHLRGQLFHLLGTELKARFMLFDFVVYLRQVYPRPGRARGMCFLAALDPARTHQLGERLLQEPQWLEQPVGIRHADTGKVITDDHVVVLIVLVGQQCPFEVGQFEKADEAERTVACLDVCFLHKKTLLGLFH